MGAPGRFCAAFWRTQRQHAALCAVPWYRYRLAAAPVQSLRRARLHCTRCGRQQHGDGAASGESAGRDVQPAEARAEALALRYCELQGVPLDDAMRERLVSTVEAATSQAAAEKAAYDSWLASLDAKSAESAAVVREIVTLHKLGDMLDAPARRRGVVGLIADELLQRAQVKLTTARTSADYGWKPRAFRQGGDQRAGQAPADTSATDSSPGGACVRKPRRGFEELLPEDWQAEAQQAEAQAAQQQENASRAGANHLVAEFDWEGEEADDLSLREGEHLELLSSYCPHDAV